MGTKGLRNLVKRLRERFPDATIIVTNIWTYMNVIVRLENGENLPFRNWLEYNGYKSNTPDAEDYVHLSTSGHNFVAWGMNKIVKEKKTKRSDKIGTWGEGDVCKNWIQSGEIPSAADFKTD